MVTLIAFLNLRCYFFRYFGSFTCFMLSGGVLHVAAYRVIDDYFVSGCLSLIVYNKNIFGVCKRFFTLARLFLFLFVSAAVVILLQYFGCLEKHHKKGNMPPVPLRYCGLDGENQVKSLIFKSRKNNYSNHIYIGTR